MRISLPAIPFLLLALATSTAVAQSPPESPSSSAINLDPLALLDRIKNLTEQLNLNTEQRTQIDAIFKSSAEEMQGAIGDLQNASPEEKTARFGQLLGDLREEIGPLLDDDQKAELQQKLQGLRNPSTAPEDTGNTPNQRSQTPAVAGGQAGGAGQSGAPPAGAGPGTGAGAGRGVQMLTRLKNGLDQLGLSADQQTQIDQILEDIRQQLQTLRAGVGNGTVDRDSARDKVLSILQASRTKLAGILTPEQQDKLRQLLPQNPGAPGNRPPGDASSGTGSKNTPIARPSSPVPPPASSPQPLAVGQQAPDFSLRTLNGETVGLSSYNHKLLVLVLGSYTNPSLRDRAPGLESLREHYSGLGVSFLLVYTRETHPTGGWEIDRNKTDNIDIAQPKTQPERNRIAEGAKAAMNLSVPFAPDTMDDKTGTAYAVGDGVAAYLISRDGKILFHQSWLEPMALGDAIEEAVK